MSLIFVILPSNTSIRHVSQIILLSRLSAHNGFARHVSIFKSKPYDITGWAKFNDWSMYGVPSALSIGKRLQMVCTFWIPTEYLHVQYHVFHHSPKYVQTLNEKWKPSATQPSFTWEVPGCFHDVKEVQYDTVLTCCLTPYKMLSVFRKKQYCKLNIIVKSFKFTWTTGNFTQ